MPELNDILNFLKDNPGRCDDCLAEELCFSRRQKVNRLCNRSTAIFHPRPTVKCTHCEEAKKINLLSGRPHQERHVRAGKRTRTTRKAKKTKTVRHRENELRNRFNEAMADVLNLTQEDFYSRLNFEGLLKLKEAYSLINNVVTLKLSLTLADRISDRLSLDPEARMKLYDSVNTSEANACGFDVDTEQPNVIGEVKGNIPVKGGSVFGEQQQSGLTNDVFQMFGKPGGKREIHAMSKRNKIFRPERAGAFKFLGLYDSDRVREATARWQTALLKNPEWLGLQKGNGYHIEDLPETGDLSPKTVYIVYLTPKQPPASEGLLLTGVPAKPPMVELNV